MPEFEMQEDEDGFLYVPGCRECADARISGGSHYHCPDCGEPCSMFGHRECSPPTPVS